MTEPYEHLKKTYNCVRCLKDFRSLVNYSLTDKPICDKKDCYQTYIERKKLAEV